MPIVRMSQESIAVWSGALALAELSMYDLTRRPPRRLLDRALLVALTAMLCLFASTAHMAAELQPVDAGQMKAVFVVNFLRFVEWPSANVAPAPAPLVVAVLGDRAFIENLRDYATGQSVSGHAIEVKAVERPEDARGAHMLFIGSSESANVPAIVKMAETSALLTVGDTDGFARAGVILNLYTVDQRVRIEANPSAATRTGLRLSAHLLRIARIVD
jgi:hypothetical protein